MKEIGQRIIFDEPDEILDPQHTVLVIWNVQEALMPQVFNSTELQNNVRRLLASARMAGVKVVYSRSIETDLDFEFPWTIFLSMRRRKLSDPRKLPFTFEPGTGDSNIHDSVVPSVNDVVINNRSGSLFYGSHFDAMMRGAGISTVIFSGIGTELGIENSVREASTRGYYTVVCRDCVSTFSKEANDVSIKNMSNVALLYGLDEITELWKRR